MQTIALKYYNNENIFLSCYVNSLILPTFCKDHKNKSDLIHILWILNVDSFYYLEFILNNPIIFFLPFNDNTPSDSTKYLSSRFSNILSKSADIINFLL